MLYTELWLWLKKISTNIRYLFPFEQWSVLFSSTITTCQFHSESQSGAELFYSIEANSIVITPLFRSFTNSIISWCNVCVQNTKQQKWWSVLTGAGSVYLETAKLNKTNARNLSAMCSEPWGGKHRGIPTTSLRKSCMDKFLVSRGHLVRLNARRDPCLQNYSDATSLKNLEICVFH